MWAFSGLVHGADALRRWHQYRDRSGRACTRRRLHTASGQRGERDQRHALRKTGLQFHPRHRASCGITSIPIVLVVNPSFRVKTVPELIAYAKANPGKITMASPFSVRPAVAPTKLEDLKQRDQQLEPRRGRAAQGARKNAARFKREIEFDRRRPANSLNKSSTQLGSTLGPC
jgi:Tripartite tricarboxylate transporter family receptor